MNLKNRNLPFGKILVTSALLLLFLYFSKPLEVLGQLKDVKPFYYIAGLVVFLTIYPLNGLRWKIMTSKKAEISFRDSVKIVGISYGLNKILPLNSGDIARSKIMEQYSDFENHGSILGIVALERLMDIGLISLILALVFFMNFSTILPGYRWIVMPLFVATALFAVIYAMENWIKKALDLAPDRFTPEIIKEFLKDALEGFKSLDRKQYIEALILSTARWCFNVLAFYLVAISAGHPINIALAALLTGVMSLISSMPITPAGAGVAEVSATGLLIFLGFDNSAAATIVILQRSLGVVIMGIIGLLLINLEQFQIGEFRDLTK